MDNNPFFGTGYKKKKVNQTQGYMKAIKGELPESDDVPEEVEQEYPAIKLDGCNVAVNVMGEIYTGNEKIEMIAGEVIVDGVRKGKLPITSGTWIKKLKGNYFQNGSLTIVSKCATIERSD